METLLLQTLQTADKKWCMSSGI